MLRCVYICRLFLHNINHNSCRSFLEFASNGTVLCMLNPGQEMPQYVSAICNILWLLSELGGKMVFFCETWLLKLWIVYDQKSAWWCPGNGASSFAITYSHLHVVKSVQVNHFFRSCSVQFPSTKCRQANKTGVHVFLNNLSSGRFLWTRISLVTKHCW